MSIVIVTLQAYFSLLCCILDQIKLEKATQPISCRKTYLLAIVEKEQCGISPYTILGAHLIMLCAIYLNGTKRRALIRKYT